MAGTDALVNVDDPLSAESRTTSPAGTARIRWNEYAAQECEEAIRAFEEVEATNEHLPGVATVLVRGRFRGCLARRLPELLRGHEDLRRRTGNGDCVTLSAKMSRPGGFRTKP